MAPYRAEFLRYHHLLCGALAQVPATTWHVVPGLGGNSIAVLLAHLAGNLRSRFNAFLDADGESPERDREAEFHPAVIDPQVLVDAYNSAIGLLFTTLDGLADPDRSRPVRIRGRTLRVDEALARSLAHVAYHVGEVVQLCRQQVGTGWKSLSIPLGESIAYARDPRRDQVVMVAPEPLRIVVANGSQPVHVVVRHRVADYPTWKRIFDAAAPLRRSGGELTFQVLVDPVDTRQVIHLACWRSVAEAQAFFHDPEIAEIRRQAGVETPEYHFMHRVDEGIT